MAKPKTAKARPALRLALLRDLHIYVSVFVAPSLLFFAATGGLQTFRIPDQKAAPALLVKLARVHKDDVFALKPERPKPPAGKKAEAPPKKPPPKPSTTVLKWFFAVVSVGIIASTVLGLWMALAYSRRKAVIWAILAIGAAAPVLILMA
ncbi:MAG: hypothetical protein JWO33_235 [Caulobacteraceae bacterium]|nr:hypothetical protein [Caulobacteraceae bacterium]